jgi:hypothetical protein
MHHFSGGFSKNREDAILGLCWLRKHHDRFVAGSSQGLISMCDVRSATDNHENNHSPKQKSYAPLTSASDGEISTTSSLAENRNREGAAASQLGASSTATSESAPLSKGVVARFPEFEKLTSIHVDATDTAMIACGYNLDVKLYDLETAKVVREYKEVLLPASAQALTNITCLITCPTVSFSAF